jgi:hypothetical protein
MKMVPLSHHMFVRAPLILLATLYSGGANEAEWQGIEACPEFLGLCVEHRPQSSGSMRDGRHPLAQPWARYHHVSPVWGLGGSSHAGPTTLAAGTLTKRA